MSSGRRWRCCRPSWSSRCGGRARTRNSSRLFARPRREVDRLARLAEDLLVLARIEDGRLPLRKSELDVGDLLRSVARRFSSRVAASTGRSAFRWTTGWRSWATSFASNRRLGTWSTTRSVTVKVRSGSKRLDTTASSSCASPTKAAACRRTSCRTHSTRSHVQTRRVVGVRRVSGSRSSQPWHAPTMEPSACSDRPGLNVVALVLPAANDGPGNSDRRGSSPASA